MSIFKTLADLQKATEVAEYSEDGPSVGYLTVKDKESYLIRFRDELVQNAPGYVEEEDGPGNIARVVSIHSNPLDFKKSAVCTAGEEDGYKCWACEQVGVDPKWKAKKHLLINIAVFNADTKEWEPKVLDQKFTSAHVGQNIIDMAVEYESLLTHDYKISRKGAGTKTQYNLLPVGVKDEDPSVADLPRRDLATAQRKFEYAQQAGFYVSSEDSGTSEGW